MNKPSSIARRDFLKVAAGMVAMTSVQPLTAQVAQEDPGIAFVLSPAELEKGAALLRQVFTPFMGEWLGTRESRDTGVKGPVTATQRYSLYMGGPQVVAEVEALVDGVAVFSAAKMYVYSATKNTILTYFFEIGGNVQIFELDRKRLDEGKLFWNEIVRKGAQFRVEEAIPQNDEWEATVFMQDGTGKYQVFARNLLRRKWKEAYRRKTPDVPKQQ